MSFKPELFADEEGKQLPLALDDELFILERAKITFQCKTPDGEADGASNFAWKITFANGGTGVVLPVFLRLLDKRKKKGRRRVWPSFAVAGELWLTRWLCCSLAQKPST
ncbi:hypothetical protein BBJ28_00020083 [Nothophytophthora sp. Chile5]|nr:hypothetical protein BBJ28_00020083 [Nothophytophthora sp. Chile5]